MASTHVLYCICVLQLLISTTGAFIHCPKCQGVGNVQQCQHATIRCAGNQVCQGTMENFAVSMECAFPAVCQAEAAMGSVNCTGGAPFSSTDVCRFCCSDLDSCNHTLRHVQKGIDGSSDVLHCPTCPPGTKDPHRCLDNLQPCQPSVKVCSVEWSLDTVTAGCTKSEIECRLHESNSHFACQEERLHADAYCTHCCDSAECLMKAFYITTTAPPTTTTTTPIPTTTTPVPTTTTPVPTTTTPMPTTTTPMPTTTTPVPTTTTPVPTTTTPLPTTMMPVPRTTTTTATTTTPVPSSPPNISRTSEPQPTLSMTNLATILSSSAAAMSSAPTSTSSPSTSPMVTSAVPTDPATTNTAAVVTVPSCVDNVKGIWCKEKEGVCEQTIGHILCPYTCGFCATDLPAVLVG